MKLTLVERSMLQYAVGYQIADLEQYLAGCRPDEATPLDHETLGRYRKLMSKLIDTRELVF